MGKQAVASGLFRPTGKEGSKPAQTKKTKAPVVEPTTKITGDIPNGLARDWRIFTAETGEKKREALANAIRLYIDTKRQEAKNL